MEYSILISTIIFNNKYKGHVFTATFTIWWILMIMVITELWACYHLYNIRERPLVLWGGMEHQLGGFVDTRPTGLFSMNLWNTFSDFISLWIPCGVSHYIYCEIFKEGLKSTLILNIEWSYYVGYAHFKICENSLFNLTRNIFMEGWRIFPP